MMSEREPIASQKGPLTNTLDTAQPSGQDLQISNAGRATRQGADPLFHMPLNVLLYHALFGGGLAPD